MRHESCRRSGAASAKALRVLSGKKKVYDVVCTTRRGGIIGNSSALCHGLYLTYSYTSFFLFP